MINRNTVRECTKINLRLAEVEPQLEKAAKAFHTVDDKNKPAFAAAHQAYSAVLKEAEKLRDERTRLSHAIMRDIDKIESAFDIATSIRAIAVI